jgi:ABC-type dipeptide/oligopeptide/nickel transport system permease subunit
VIRDLADALRALRRSGALPAATLLAMVVAVGLLAPGSGYDVVADVDPSRAHALPGAAHWLGTDHLGRDILSRLIYACSSFVGPGLVCCVIAAGLGVPAGAVAGYRGAWVESGLRYGFTVLASLPVFVLVLLVLSIYGDDLWLLSVVAGVAYVPTLGEEVFGRIEGLRHADYVLANRAYGVPDWRILWVHLVGAACARLIARHLVTLFGTFLILETTLAYLGSGVQEPQPSWGNMLVFEWGRDSGNPFTVLAPALALWLTVAATMRLSESLREVGR